jgi:hypothetical protein
MAIVTFTGPVRSLNGFLGPGPGSVVGPGIVFTAVPKASLPAPTAALTGGVMMVSDASAGNNLFALVICTGAAWVLATGAPLV